MEVEQQLPLEGEEELFYAELKNRISLLIMEDEDSDSESPSVVDRPAATHRVFQPGFPRWVSSYPAAQFAGAPTGLAMMVCAGYGGAAAAKGTGVFIPASGNLPRRKSSRSGRCRQVNRGRRAGWVDPPPTTADRHAATTCMGNASLAGKQRHRQLPSSKKGVAMTTC